MNDIDEKGTSEFKISLGDDAPASDVPEELRDNKLIKLSQRVTLITILIPCLIGVILLFIYYNIQRNVTTTFDTEAKTVKNLSKTLDASVQSLTRQNKELNDTITNRFSEVDKTISALSEKAKKNRESVFWLDRVKAAKKSLASAQADIDKSIVALNDNIKSLSEDGDALEESVTSEMGRLSEALEKQTKEARRMRKEMADISSQKIDKRDLYVLLEDRQKIYQQRMEQMIKDMERSLDAAKKRINALEKHSLPDGAASELLKTDNSSPSKQPTPNGGKTAEKASGLPKPGTIVEEDIQ